MYFKVYRVNVDETDVEIYITDESKTAKELRDRNEAVLVYLHPENRDQDFSEFIYAVEEPEGLEEDYLRKVYKRLKSMPWDILETDRCMLRETTVEDVGDFYSIYSEPSITAYMEDLFADVEEEKQYIRDYIEKVYGYYEFGVWTVIEKETGAVIGRAGLSCREGFEEPELGFVIGVPWQGKGYAYEICKAILKYGVEELEFTKIQALVQPGNAASISLCEKLGMKSVGQVNVEQEEYVRFLYEVGT